MKKQTEVLVIGGGITGLGILFDLAQRGFKAMLVERDDLSTGTSGRFHGLLHSGGRYAVKDPHTARECYEENTILRRVIPHAIEDTGGLFVLTPDDDPAYGDRFAAACQSAGIPVEEIDIAKMLRREPLLNPGITRAFTAPDASVDTWDACHALVRGAEEYGAEVLTYHKVTDLLTRQNKVTGAAVKNILTGENLTIEADMVINAAGAWAGQIARMAGCEVKIVPGKGAMVAMNYRMVNTLINRCHVPGDGDILVPVGSVAVIGTTSIQVSEPDDLRIEDWEVQRMLDEGEKLIPSFKQFRPLRAWAGVRPLYQETVAGSDTRDVTRGHQVLDHAARDGVEGFVSIVGGKWTTYRLMAQDTVDAVCRKLNTNRPCRTADTLLPAETGLNAQRYYHVNERLRQREHGELSGQLICECELVTRQQIEEKLADSDTLILNDLRRDLRVGMGPCQGGFCSYRVAGIMHRMKQINPQQTNRALSDFIQSRWKGVRPVLWGQGARQMQLDEGIYFGLLGLDKLGSKRSVPSSWQGEGE
ncbi:MAG TPA: anaerobic glycerol-3-phosphate dehydrogenase subunit A [Chloroflexi bacterium]|nr:anaerobic glycerol-3-phosphate dehydrogenase subunit A [Chloroflexota bacterium]